MKIYRFPTVIPESGVVRIPKRIYREDCRKFDRGHSQEVDAEEKPSHIKSLRGKYRHVLSFNRGF